MIHPLRQPLVFGDVRLSIQGSEIHYCAPRTWLDNLRDYQSVELGLLGPLAEVDWPTGGTRRLHPLIRPSQIGIMGFDDLFESGAFPVAGYVSWDRVDALIAELKKYAGIKE